MLHHPPRRIAAFPPFEPGLSCPQASLLTKRVAPICLGIGACLGPTPCEITFAAKVVSHGVGPRQAPIPRQIGATLLVNRLACGQESPGSNGGKAAILRGGWCSIARACR